MQMVTDHVRWCATDVEGPLLQWAADRAAVGACAGAPGRHLAPVSAVGRDPTGRLAVEVLRPSGTPLAAALDVLGVPTTGVAVTLTVPMLELAVADRSGAVRIGSAGPDDVLVDDAGAVVLCDRPPVAVAGRAGPFAAEASDPADPVGANGRASRRRGLRTAGSVRSAADGARVEPDGCRALVLAARTVWERTDPRDPARPGIDAALASALVGDLDAARAALAVVRATAAPRPVRWQPPTDDLLVEPAPPPRATPEHPLTAVVRDAVERGIPLGEHRRLPLRHAIVGLVVTAGATAAAVFALG